MDLTIDQGTLHRALRLVGRAVAAKPALPILHSVLLQAAGGRLTLAGTDLEIGVVTVVAADVVSPGRVAVPARLLGDYVAQLPPAPVRLTIEPGASRLQARCGRFVAGLATADADEFPAIPGADGGVTLEVSPRDLRVAIERVAFAAARDDSRPVLKAVQVRLGVEALTLAATDGFRLARARVAGGSGEAPEDVLVPARAASEMARLLADADSARLALLPERRGVCLLVKETTLFARLLEGHFPDLERVVPQQWRTRVTVDTADFRQAVRIAGLFGDGEARPVVLDAAPGRLHLRARGDQGGNAETELPAAVEGEALGVTLNTRLFADLLDVVTDRRLELQLTGPQAPVVVREAGQPEGADLWVLMPLCDAAPAQRQPGAA